MADLKKIKIGETTYDLVDAGARELISELSSYTDYLGVTTTKLEDGSTTNPITIDDKEVTAKKGNIANYGSKEFIFNGTTWAEFGDLSGLGELAFVDSAEGKYTPSGDITDPTVTLGGTAEAAAQTITLTSTEKSIPNVTAVGSMPTFTVDENGVLTITDGVVPTLGDAISVHDVTDATAAASSVDITNLTATATGTAFTGTEATITVTKLPV